MAILVPSGTIVDKAQAPALGPAVTIELRVIRKGTAGEDEVRLGRVTVALERLPDGGACISGIPDFLRDRATQECYQSLAAEGCPLRLELVLMRAAGAPGRLNSPADLGRLIWQSLTAVRRLLASQRAAVTAVSGWLGFLADRLAAAFLREDHGGADR